MSKPIRVGDRVKIADEKGWWECVGTRRGWLQLSQETDGGKCETIISTLETTVTAIAHKKKK